MNVDDPLDIQRYCAVCGYSLDHVTDTATGETGWLHPPQAALDCSVAVPVRIEEIRANVICDVCMTDASDEPWTVPVAPFAAASGYGSSASAWLCCQTCATLMTAGKWGRLIRRAATAVADRGGLTHQDHRDQVMMAVRADYAALRTHVLAPPRPGVPAPHGGQDPLPHDR